jgi:MFS family permease
MGALGTYVSIRAIFIASAILCIPALFALYQIRPDEIEYVRARNAAKHDHTLDLQRLVDFAKKRNLLLFAVCMVLFSNASLLPLVGQNLAHSKNAHGAAFMAGLIVVPQIIVAILAPWIGYWSELWGRKPLLLIGFAVEASRALLFSLVADPGLMIVVQVLDGITGAVVTVLTILVITDLTTGTGRFNLAQGVIGTFTGIAAAISPSAMGFIVLHFGDSTGFLTMAVFMLLGMSILWLLLPETKPVEYLD